MCSDISDEKIRAKLQNTPQLWSASLTCVGRLWRSRHNTIDAILIQWHGNELRGILKLLQDSHNSTPANRWCSLYTVCTWWVFWLKDYSLFSCCCVFVRIITHSAFKTKIMKRRESKKQVSVTIHCCFTQGWQFLFVKGAGGVSFH